MNNNEEHNFENEPNFPFNKKGENPFGLPSDYFASFEEKIKLKLELENELAEFPLLNGLSKESVFTTPTTYFNKIANSIEYQAELSAYSKLEALKKPLYNELDAEYTNILKQSINYKIELVDELASYQTLYHLDKINPFIVSDNYFESFASNVKDRLYAITAESVSIIDTVIDFVFGKKIAFAFSIILIVGLSVFIYNSLEPIQTSNCETLACLEKQEIINHQSFSNFDDEQLMEMVNVNSLNKQLNTTASKVDSTQNEEYILDNVNTDQLLEEL
jgi:hypothetical protein